MNDSQTRQLATALLTDLAAHLTQRAHTDLHIPLAQAKAFGNDTAAYIADHWGGQILYVPKDMAGLIASRDAKLYAKFTGNNHAELAQAFGLSFQHVHRIIKRERAKRSIKQHDLPF